MNPARRDFMVRSAAFGLGFAGLGLLSRRAGGVTRLAALEGEFSPTIGAYGDLIRDPAGLCDLPREFSYRVLSRMGEIMDDGLIVPGKHDGMASFSGSSGRTILVRNHELDRNDSARGPFGANGELLPAIDESRIYDRGAPAGTSPRKPCQGGTTTIVYNTRTQTVERHFMSLAGTVLNCAGGPTPWGSWLTCEETNVMRKDGAGEDHGWVFEVPAREAIGLADPVPLKAMGRFRHEAVAIDPATGICYLTEDVHDGLLYRFLPKEPGNLRAGGRLQALMVRDHPSLDTRNWPKDPSIPVGTRMAARWIDAGDPHSPGDTLRLEGLRAGAAVFARAEGAWFGATADDRSLYYCCTSGGVNQKGQIWRYQPGPREGSGEGTGDEGGVLELFVEPRDDSLLEYPDNITAAPWGDLIVTEDGPGVNHILGITPKGSPYKICRCPRDDHEWAGACFSPDGTTLFANVQGLGLTVAIRGPWNMFRV